jgi:hypothetical protein
MLLGISVAHQSLILLQRILEVVDVLGFFHRVAPSILAISRVLKSRDCLLELDDRFPHLAAGPLPVFGIHVEFLDEHIESVSEVGASDFVEALPNAAYLLLSA